MIRQTAAAPPLRATPSSTTSIDGHGRARRGIAVAALLCLMLAATSCAAAIGTSSTSAPVSLSTDEAAFVRKINQLRSSEGLAPLTVDRELTEASRRWAKRMSGDGRIYHASELSTGVTAPWLKLGENVGVGDQTGRLFQAFVDSPGHYANLIDPQFTRVGVGVVVTDGRIYTTHRFMSVETPRSAAPAAPPRPTPPTTAAPSRMPAPPASTAPTTTLPAPTTTVAPATVAPTTVPPTTVPPTTTPSTTTTTTTEPPADVGKLGPLRALGELLDEE